MFAKERYDEIIKILKQKKSVTATELSKKFGVSLETIRRDLFHLEEKGLLSRVHGGAISVSGMGEYKSLKQRLGENTDKKIKASENAMQFICEDDVIAVDCGSTAVEFARVLKNSFEHLTVVTHSLDVYYELKDKSGFKLIIIGGEYSQDEDSNYGFLAVDMINNLHFSKLFIFPLAISLKGGLYDQGTKYIPIQRAYIKNADKIFYVADSSKFETIAVAKIKGIEEEDIFVTDSMINDDIKKIYEENGVKIVTGQR